MQSFFAATRFKLQSAYEHVENPVVAKKVSKQESDPVTSPSQASMTKQQSKPGPASKLERGKSIKPGAVTSPP